MRADRRTMASRGTQRLWEAGSRRFRISTCVASPFRPAQPLKPSMTFDVGSISSCCIISTVAIHDRLKTVDGGRSPFQNADLCLHRSSIGFMRSGLVEPDEVNPASASFRADAFMKAFALPPGGCRRPRHHDGKLRAFRCAFEGRRANSIANEPVAGTWRRHGRNSRRRRSAPPSSASRIVLGWVRLCVNGRRNGAMAALEALNAGGQANHSFSPP